MRSFQSDIDGRLSEAIRSDKTRQMNRTDFTAFPGLGPFTNGESRIYKVNTLYGFIAVTFSARADDPTVPVVRLDRAKGTEVWERSFDGDPDFDSRYRRGRHIFGRLIGMVEDFKNLSEIESELDLVKVSGDEVPDAERYDAVFPVAGTVEMRDNVGEGPVED